MQRMIAYLNSDGKDFQGLPWIELVPPDVDGKEYMTDVKVQFDSRKVILFECSDDVDPFSVTWEDAKKGEIASAYDRGYED